MNFIFLDIDGVLATWSSLEQGMATLDPECVRRFLQLQEATQARVILSSSWRVSPRLVEILRNEGIPVDGQTPISRGSESRGSEIMAWMDANGGNPEGYVILDDESSAGDGHDGHLVWTHPRDGLTQEKLEEALARMVNPSPQGIDFGNPYSMVVGIDAIPSGWVVAQSFYGNGQPATAVGFPDLARAQMYLDKTPGDGKTLLSYKP